MDRHQHQHERRIAWLQMPWVGHASQPHVVMEDGEVIAYMNEMYLLSNPAFEGGKTINECLWWAKVNSVSHMYHDID